MPKIYFYISLLFLAFLTACSSSDSPQLANNKPFVKTKGLRQIKYSTSLSKVQQGKKLNTISKFKKNAFETELKWKNGRINAKIKGEFAALHKKKYTVSLIEDSSDLFQAAYETLVQNTLKKEGLLGFHSEIIKLDFLTQKNLPAFFQEGIDKRLIESQMYREGALLNISSKGEVEVLKTKKDKKALVEYLSARLAKTSNDQLFDLKYLGELLAVLDHFDAEQMLSSKHCVYYLNPINNKLYPIPRGFEANSSGDGTSIENTLLQKALEEDLVKAVYSSKIGQLSSIDISEFKYAKVCLPYFRTAQRTSLGIEASATCTSKISANQHLLSFFSIDSITMQIKPLQKKIKLDQLVFIPPNYTLRMEAGQKIDLVQGGGIVSNSKIELLGTELQPISFYSSDNNNMGVHVIDASISSLIQHCSFNGINNLKLPHWELPSGITFYRSPVSIKNTSVANNQCEDAINLFRSEFYIEGLKVRNSFSDALDTDFSNGKVLDCYFDQIGNDAIDLSGSTVSMEKVTINKTMDKAISAGEGSNVDASGILVHDASLAFTAKDHSVVKVSNSTIEKCEVAYVVFQKKEMYGPSEIYAEKVNVKKHDELFLLEQKSKLKIDGETIKEHIEDVRRYLYGKEYGKATVK